MTQEEAQQMFEEEITKLNGIRTITFSDWLNIKNISIDKNVNYFGNYRQTGTK